MADEERGEISESLKKKLEELETVEEERLDVDKLFEDFAEWFYRPRTKRESHGGRLMTNLAHVGLTFITGGVYLFGYIGYYLYKFKQTIDIEDYKVQVEVTKATEDEDDEGEQE